MDNEIIIVIGILGRAKRLLADSSEEIAHLITLHPLRHEIEEAQRRLIEYVQE